ncbi:MAG: hypothetical protein Q4G63_11525 [Bacteroidia bacterium]|nr:hypothetical protein [Bacteroidia bacterium]
MGEGSVIIKQLRNPAYGLVPLLVFIILIGFIDAGRAIGIGLGLSLVGVFIVRKHSRMLYDISAITFSVALLMLLFYSSLDTFGKFVIVEIIFVVALIISRLVRTKMIVSLTKNVNPNVRNYLSESFRVAFQIQYALFFHLLLILAYFNISTIKSPWISTWQIIIGAQVIVIAVIILEVIRFLYLDKKLNKEEWLPVVTESGEVTGKVAKSVTKEMKNKFMHPVVRVALISNGKIYLKKRDASRLLNPGMLDYPFEKYMQYKHDIDEAVHNTVRKEIGIEEIPLRFLLKYIFENNNTKRLVFLYVSVIDDEEKFNKLRLREGKLWTEKQIEDNRNSNIFSECFELEFEYLKNTVLLNYKLKPIEAS